MQSKMKYKFIKRMQLILIIGVFISFNSVVAQANDNASDEELLKDINEEIERLNKLSEKLKNAADKKSSSYSKVGDYFEIYKPLYFTDSYIFSSTHYTWEEYDCDEFRCKIKKKLCDPKVQICESIQKHEVKFQLSFKIPVYRIISDKPYFPIYFGYTQKSFWQIWDSSQSSPFRETNYNPEFFLDYGELLNQSKSNIIYKTQFGFEHESNGRSQEGSRSWNRYYFWGGIGWKGNDYNKWFISVKVWKRKKEGRIEDDNPDILSYLGSSETYLDWSPTKKFTLSMMYRWGFIKRYRDDQGYILYEKKRIKHTYSLELSCNIKNTLHWFIQYYNGYGESLIDYNLRQNRIAAGIVLRKFEWEKF